MSSGNPKWKPQMKIPKLFPGYTPEFTEEVYGCLVTTAQVFDVFILLSVLWCMSVCSFFNHNLHSKAKRRAPAYSRALRLVRGVVQKSSSKEVQVRFPDDQRG